MNIDAAITNLFLLWLLVLNVVLAGRPAPAHYFHYQWVDHLATESSNDFFYNKTWTQRYYVWEEHFQGPGHPIFLILGGEGNVEPSTGIFYPFISDHLAKDFGAYVLEPEHRFYGRSQPLEHGTPINSGNTKEEDARVKLLTSEQALLDAIRLLRHVQVNLGCNLLDRVSPNYCPVISVGGSYPGFLSAMARLVYPNVIDMSYAASAPLKFYAQQVDSKAYYQHITDVAEQTLPGCADSVHTTLYQAMIWIQHQSDDQLQHISQLLGICPDTLPDYITNTSIMVDEVLMMIGYTFANDNMAYYPPTSNHTRLRQACQLFVDNSSPTTKTSLATLQQFFVSHLAASSSSSSQMPKTQPPTCFNMRLQMPSGPRATISAGDWSGVGSGTSGESWDFQTCTLLVEAIGFETGSMFYPVRPWSSDWLERHCQNRFGVTPDPYKLAQAWKFDDLTQTNASRILFTNGLNDGWSVGSILTNQSDSLLALNFPNGAHHSDLSSKGPTDDDTDDIRHGFETIRTILQGWLNELKAGQRDGTDY